jgi:hypothetical protein
MSELMDDHIPDDHCTSSLWKVVVTKPGRRFGWHLVSYMFGSCCTNTPSVVRLGYISSLRWASERLLTLLPFVSSTASHTTLYVLSVRTDLSAELLA